jgi:hypothetical protein
MAAGVRAGRARRDLRGLGGPRTRREHEKALARRRNGVRTGRFRRNGDCRCGPGCRHLPQFPLAPGTATVTVTVAGQTSAPQTLAIPGTVAPTPTITSVQPTSATAGSAITLTATNFGATQRVGAPAREHELGSALRRSESHDHVLERYVDHLRSAAGHWLVPDQSRAGFDHGDRVRPDLQQRADNCHRIRSAKPVDEEAGT